MNVTTEAWNLDSVRMIKLQKIIRHSQARKHIENPDRDKSKSDIRLEKIEKLIATKKGQYKEDRLKYAGLDIAVRLAILGDEFRLRQELEFGYPINERSRITGRTILVEAVSTGQFPIVKLLCSEFHADVNIPTMMGSATPLHIAVTNSHRQIASLLITHGADLHAQDRRGCYPLHLVQCMSLLKLLMRYNINNLVTTKNGLLPSQYYLEQTPPQEQIPELEELLVANEENQVRAEQRDSEMLQKLLVENANDIANISLS